MTTELLIPDSVTQAIQKRYPHLPSTQVKEIASVMINELGNRLSRGEELAFLRRGADGDIELTVIGLEQFIKTDS